MAEELPSLHIDTDWKKQAQEEKRRLAEEQAKRASAATPPVTSAVAPSMPAGAAPGAATPSARSRGGRAQREMPGASFATLVQSIMTQALYYMGAMAAMGGEPVVDLDMAKHQIDTLGIIEEKTGGNLSADEQKLLDLALYETRTRFVSVASQYL